MGEKPDVTEIRSKSEVVEGVFMMPKEGIMLILDKMLSLTEYPDARIKILQFINDVKEAQTPKAPQQSDSESFANSIFNVNDMMWQKAVEFCGEITQYSGDQLISREVYNCSIALARIFNYATDANRKVVQLFLELTDLNI